MDRDAVLAYRVYEYPTLCFVDADGRLRYQSSGFDSKNGARELEFVIDEILNTGHTDSTR